VATDRERAAAAIRKWRNVDDDEIVQLLDQIDGPGVRSLVAVVTTEIKSGELKLRLDELRERGSSNDIAQQVAELSQGPLCTHGVPGGQALHPRSGKPRCPLCRAEAGAAEE
jgi:hypothetical protein